MAPRVLIADKLSPAAIEIFTARGVQADVKTGLSKDELLKIIGDYDGLAVRSATKADKDVIAAAKTLKVIGRAGIGVDNVDIPAATAAGVVVMNTPFGNSITTAEHAIAMMFALARGADFSPVSWMMAAMGLMFAAIGNYLPKCKMNATMGIKVPWAYTSEENWNATHRFGGRVWVIGGLALIFTGFLPETTAFFCMFFAILVLALVPMVYSYLYYRKQKARGDALKPLLKGAGLTKGSAIFLACLLVFVAIILFSGDLEYRFEEEYLTIDASFYQDLMIDYASIEALELREETVPGFRVGGFSSFRLLMGFFQNEEFGIHTRYTYYDPECCIVALWRGKPVVLSGEDAAQTRDLYRKLLEKVSQ